MTPKLQRVVMRRTDGRNLGQIEVRATATMASQSPSLYALTASGTAASRTAASFEFGGVPS
jgi:hypothetical protein